MLGFLRYKKTFFLYFAIFLAFFVLSLPSLTFASGYEAAINGLNQTVNTGFETGKGTDAPTEEDGVMVDLPSAIGRIVGAALSFVGIIFFVLMIYGGMLWMTARGNDQQVEKAKDLIVAAIVGLVIVFAAYAITAFIGESLI